MVQDSITGHILIVRNFFFISLYRVMFDINGKLFSFITDVLACWPLTSFTADYLLTADIFSKLGARQSPKDQSPFDPTPATWSACQNRILAWYRAHPSIQQFLSGTPFPMPFKQTTLAPLFTLPSKNISPEYMYIPWSTLTPFSYTCACFLPNRCPCFI